MCMCMTIVCVHVYVYGVSEWACSLSECSIAFLVSANDGRIIMNCRTDLLKRAQLVWSTDGDGFVPGPVTYPFIDAGCQVHINVQCLMSVVDIPCRCEGLRLLAALARAYNKSESLCGECNARRVPRNTSCGVAGLVLLTHLYI